MEGHSLPLYMLYSWWPGNSFGRVWPSENKITDVQTMQSLTEISFLAKKCNGENRTNTDLLQRKLK